MEKPRKQLDLTKRPRLFRVAQLGQTFPQPLQMQLSQAVKSGASDSVEDTGSVSKECCNLKIKPSSISKREKERIDRMHEVFSKSQISIKAEIEKHMVLKRPIDLDDD